MSPAASTRPASTTRDRKSTRLNSSHTEIYTLSLHDALPIWLGRRKHHALGLTKLEVVRGLGDVAGREHAARVDDERSEEHTSELQSHRDLHSFPTRRSSDLARPAETSRPGADEARGCPRTRRCRRPRARGPRRRR